MFDKLFKPKYKIVDTAEVIEEEPKRNVVDADFLMNRLNIIKTDYTIQRKPRNSNSYARGAVDTIDEIIEIVKGMPKNEM